MLDNDAPENDSTETGSGPAEAPDVTATPAPVVKRTTRKRATKAAGTPAPVVTQETNTAPVGDGPVDPATAGAEASSDKPAKKTAKKAAAKKTAAKKTAAKKTAAKKTAAKKPTPVEATGETGDESGAGAADASASATAVLFQTPEPTVAPPRKRASRKQAAAKTVEPAEGDAADETLSVSAPETDDPDQTDASMKPKGRGRGRGRGKSAETSDDTSQPATDTPIGDRDAGSSDDSGDAGDDDDDDEGGTKRRPRRRGGRRRRKGGGDDSSEDSAESENKSGGSAKDDSEGDSGEGGAGSSRRRRRRRRSDDGDGDGDGNGSSTGPSNGSNSGGGGRGRRSRNPEDEITALSGSTRLEAKRQRRREGREAGRRRAPIVSEAEFLARRESVERVMAIRQRDELTQIGVLEDDVLVEHYVARESQTSLIGNVYLGRVQNVLPSMEAAFIDIGKGRNAVLYAGEVNWSALGAKDGQARKIESVLKSGQPILVQVTKDPIGHKGARLTSQVSLPGRFLVLVPDGTTSGISRKLPDNERHRLKTLLKEMVPDSAGVIVRTAAEGASEEELTQDVERLTARWDDIEAKVTAGGGKGGAPQLLYGEPDLTLKVVRDLFTEDFSKLVVQGDGAWDLVQDYVAHVAPDLSERLEKYAPDDHDGTDLFASYRLDEQVAKGLDRKVWLPSGGSLVIDRTEAMTVVDVNTGKFTGSGGNLEETVTKNNLESAEEIVRQLRLRDIGGIVVIDFIDMVLESNRDLVLRRLVECLGRDRTRHQVAEVTSLGLVQMTRKRIGTGLLEAFSEDCEHCKGRGLTVHDHPIEPSNRPDDGERRGGRRGRGNGNAGNDGDRSRGGQSSAPTPATHAPSPADIAAMPRHEPSDATPVPDVGEDDVTDASSTSAPEAAAVQTVQAVQTTEPVDTPREVEQGRESRPQDQPRAEATPEASAPASAPSPEPEHEVDPAPTVVTSSRRRSARRPAGPPVNAPVEPVVDPAEDSAGDPAGAAGGDEPAADSDEESSSADGFVLHVPIKRRGARKR